MRKRLTVRKSKEKEDRFPRPSNALKAPPTIREESPSPTPSDQSKQSSVETNKSTNLFMGSNRHSPVLRKLSDVPVSNKEKVAVSPKLPGQRKISLGAALSGAPTFSSEGKLVHNLDKASLVASSFTSSATTSTTADSDTEEHEYYNTQAHLRERREQKKLREKQNAASPPTSDSETERESNSLWTGKLGSSGSGKSNGRSREVLSRIRQWERRLSSDSEDSISSPTRRPVATPRARKPETKAKPEFSSQQQNFIPPRPRQSQISRARGKIGVSKKDEPEPPLVEQSPQLNLPPRPRGTEIRRARQGKPNTPTPPSPSPPTPKITATNDKGHQKVVLSPNSAFKPITSNHRGPSPGLAIVREERDEDAGTTPSALGLNRRPRSPRGKSPSRSPSPAITAATSGESLAPPKPSRKDRHSSETTLDTASNSPSPSSSNPAYSSMLEMMTSSAGGEGEGENPFNQQMAETLIKYVLASQDVGLKDALRKCILSNPEAVQALQQ